MTSLAEQVLQEAARKLARSMGKVVVWNTRQDDDTANTDDARLLLEALGLIDGPDGHELVPVDGRPMPTSEHKATPGARTQSVTTVEQRPENCTTPPGLRDLAPAATPVVPKRARRKPRTLTEELEELEATDPEVAAAARSHDAMVERVTARPATPPAPPVGASSSEDLAEQLVPIAAQLVAVVRDEGPERVEAVLATVPAGRCDALAVVLAAMVDPARTPRQLLAWTRDLVHQPAPPADSAAIPGETEFARLIDAGVPAVTASDMANAVFTAATHPTTRRSA